MYSLYSKIVLQYMFHININITYLTLLITWTRRVTGWTPQSQPTLYRLKMSLTDSATC